MDDALKGPRVSSMVEILLGVLDDAWSHPWEGLSSALDGIREEEAAWRPPFYAAEEGKPGEPAPGTVRWHIDHLRRCKDEYAAQLSGEEVSSEEIVGDSLSALRTRLEASHARQRGALQALSDDALRRERDGVPLAETIRAQIRHDTWHAAQIVIVRRAWRESAK